VIKPLQVFFHIDVHVFCLFSILLSSLLFSPCIFGLLIHKSIFKTTKQQTIIESQTNKKTNKNLMAAILSTFALSVEADRIQD
jgi:hypothetical protein